jgi:hypothetical protein
MLAFAAGRLKFALSAWVGRGRVAACSGHSDRGQLQATRRTPVGLVFEGSTQAAGVLARTLTGVWLQQLPLCVPLGLVSPHRLSLTRLGLRGGYGRPPGRGAGRFKPNDKKNQKTVTFFWLEQRG